MNDLSDPGLTATAPMLADVARQAGTLAGLLARGPEIAAFAAARLTPAPGGRLWAVGSGDGWFAARVVAEGSPTMRAASSLAFVTGVAPTLGPADRVLAISMSGQVDRTLEAAQAALAAGAGLAILTNGDGGRLGALGAPRLSLGLPEIAPFLCGTASYTATLAALGLIAGGADGGFARALAAVVPAIADLIARADAAASALLATLGGPPPGARFLGVGAGVATADYGAAKCVEVTATPAWSDDVEEFAHRQYWGMRRDELVVLLPSDAREASYADATAEALGRLGAPTLALEPEGAAVPHALARLSLPGGRTVAPVMQAVALQLLAYRLGRAGGLDPDRRLHLKGDAERFAVSRLLTRRSLLGSGL